MVAGGLCALVTLAYASSFATLIFGGPLAPSVNLGVWTAIIGSCAAVLTLSFLSSFRFALGGPDSNPSAILAISAAAIAGEILQDPAAVQAELLPTIFIFLFGSAVLCGLLLYVFGRLRWGRYVRYIPHPVVGGFLAGTGYLLLAGAWKMLVGENFASTSATDLQAVPLLGWVFALGVGLALIIATRAYAILQGEMRNVGVNTFGRNAEMMLSLDQPALDWVSLARGMGVPGTRATTGEELAAQLASALATPGPALIEAVI
jgi:SulP family sulfate permease